MPDRSIKFRFVITLVLITLLSAFAFADTIRLKDGSIIKGKIMSFDSGTFVLAIGEGSRRRQLSFLASEIASISFDSPAGPQQNAVTNRTASYEEPVKIAPPRVIKSDNSGKATPPSLNPSGSGMKMKPVQWEVKVLADNTSNGWTNTGWVVKKGQRIRITGAGKVSLGKGETSTPSGESSINDDQKLLKNVATGALIGSAGIAGAVTGSSSTTSPSSTSTPKYNTDPAHEAGESAQRQADEASGKAGFGPGGHSNTDPAHEAGESAAHKAEEAARDASTGTGATSGTSAATPGQ